ncbi:hypothetical protein LG943_20475 [Streptomonospora sp. S1-112]|uniref:Uncharacterized protein n=1 Tax=Streptomonospora mangrovi TaxID=2883123 RepID=A0A9X3SF81_9ACTN|nr:hypothetical protein [Streptomonospora mangrovi]MDA0566668.1 hypothetical protein [Streptomonospora mangrovi]
MSRRWGPLAACLVAVWLIVPAVLAAARWPRWWDYIAQEMTPMTWVQSVVLVLAAAGALLVAFVLRRTEGGGTGGARTGVWWLLAAGFAVLALDERFALHERVRDGYLAPRGVTVPFLPWVAPGDFLVMGLALVGLALLPAVWRAVRVDTASRNALVAGVLLAVVAVGIDSVDPATWTVAAERVQQSLEEVVELGSGLAFLAAIVLRLTGLLAAHLPSAVPHEPPVAARPAPVPAPPAAGGGGR